MKKKRTKKKKNTRNLNKFSIQFITSAEIKEMNSEERIKTILEIVSENNLLIIQGKLKPEEETRLIGNTMALIGKSNDFKGVELAIISDNHSKNFLDKLRKNIVKMLSGGDLGIITIVGPATVVKEIQRNPKKIELFFRN